ncbi:response regulator [Psychroserpens sp.]|uniref:response regulator n=1 Tax=Psychroserpens sp. TaxID=2020870 RepID=UPI001B1E6BB6|nr:response regulator [Psychroserpens sp.]MBO6605706.1 response regulator [Psychroserpens sp.]MBO6630441.1 response regulator [Psychroserpens sp.]MBO6652923.1 response regulator [Psychroserpens sp.]MBO6681305.1 response regulator [Psychroserpens sp.]MBO6749080.1 response regulator [Psychroserpens sp.]
MKKKILVIDDEVTMTTLLQFFLGETYSIHAVSSGKEAITWLNSNIPDLIISDIQMPEMNGFDFLKALRLIGYTKHTPVIMLSGKSESKERVKCYQLGAQDYLTKPFNPQELEELVKKNLFPIHYASAW